MSRIKYYFGRLFEIDWKNMFRVVGKISKRCHKPYILILFDTIWCSIKYGAGYMDYFQFFFENLNSKQRATYINRTVNNKYHRLLNNRDYFHLFQNKHEFLNTYKEFIKRDFLLLDESTYDEFLYFVKKHPVFIAKPDDGLCGIGVELVDTNGCDLKDLYDKLLTNKQNLLEERIVQNTEMNKLYPEAINTLRVVTINRFGKVSVPFVALRIGTGGRHVDNFHAGGCFSVVDSDGVVRKPALDKENRIYDVHPDTGAPIIGFKVPMYDEVIEQCKKMALVTPEIGYTGWDMAIGEKGIDVVEANQLPGYDIYQSYPHLNADLCGLKPCFDEAIFNK